MPRGQIGEVCNLAIMVSVFVANPAHASPCKPGGTVFNTAVSNFIFPFGLESKIMMMQMTVSITMTTATLMTPTNGKTRTSTQSNENEDHVDDRDGD